MSLDYSYIKAFLELSLIFYFDILDSYAMFGYQKVLRKKKNKKNDFFVFDYCMKNIKEN